MTDIETRDSSLNWDVYVTPGIPQSITSDLPPGTQRWMWSPISSTLISGQRDAVLVDAFITIEQAHALVEWVEAHSGERVRALAGHPEVALLSKFRPPNRFSTFTVIRKNFSDHALFPISRFRFEHVPHFPLDNCILSN